MPNITRIRKHPTNVGQSRGRCTHRHAPSHDAPSVAAISARCRCRASRTRHSRINATPANRAAWPAGTIHTLWRSGASGRRPLRKRSKDNATIEPGNSAASRTVTATTPPISRHGRRRPVRATAPPAIVNAAAAPAAATPSETSNSRPRPRAVTIRITAERSLADAISSPTGTASDTAARTATTAHSPRDPAAAPSSIGTLIQDLRL